MHKFLVHRKGDHVGVAVEEVRPGERVDGVYMDTDEVLHVTARDTVPLGHKIALIDLGEGDKIVEYGVQIGLAKKAVRAGELVHTHNIKSARW